MPGVLRASKPSFPPLMKFIGADGSYWELKMEDILLPSNWRLHNPGRPMYKKNLQTYDEPMNQKQAHYRAPRDRERVAENEEDTSCSIPPGDDPERKREVALRRDVGLFSSITVLLSATIGGLCAAELGALVPASGGNYAFFLAAGRPYGRYGDVPAFLFAWTSFFVDPAQITIQGLTFSAYVLSLPYPNCAPPYEVEVLVACLFIIFRHSSFISRCGIGYVFDDLLLLRMECHYLHRRKKSRTLDGTSPLAIAVSTTIIVVTYLLTNLAFFVVLDADTITST
ncbi:hypothetical protein MTO96_048883 [Rhipicephalus appendiculatus]